MANSNFVFVGCDLHEKTLGESNCRESRGLREADIRQYGASRAKLIADLKQRAGRIGGARIVLTYEASGQGFLLCYQKRRSFISVW